MTQMKQEDMVFIIKLIECYFFCVGVVYSGEYDMFVMLL